MMPFRYERASGVAEACAAAAQPAAKFVAGGTNLHRSHEAADRDAGTSGRHRNAAAR